MKIRNIILTLCMLMIVSMPINAQANEMKTNAIGGSTVISNQQIEILEPEEAKRIHMKAMENKGISPFSNLAMSTIGITEGDNIIYVTYSTRSRTIADKIGARNITFQAKSLLGEVVIQLMEPVGTMRGILILGQVVVRKRQGVFFVWKRILFSPIL